MFLILLRNIVFFKVALKSFEQPYLRANLEKINSGKNGKDSYIFQSNVIIVFSRKLHNFFLIFNTVQKRK